MVVDLVFEVYGVTSLTVEEEQDLALDIMRDIIVNEGESHSLVFTLNGSSSLCKLNLLQFSLFPP